MKTHPQVFHMADSLAIKPESDYTCCGLLANQSRPEELIGRYGGLTLADLSATCIARFHSKYTKTVGCWFWQAGTYPRGYGMIAIGRRDDGRQINSYAHRVAYVLAKGPIPPGMVVLHRCDQPRCVNPDHLRLGTQGDNNRDTAQKRRCPKERPWLQKLSDGDVRAIQISFASGDALAACYRVSKTTISLIRRGLRRKAA
jgi:hypothetical protein